LTYPLSRTKNEKKLLLHKATVLMMISFSTFSTMHINLLETKKGGVKIKMKKKKARRG